MFLFYTIVNRTLLSILLYFVNKNIVKKQSQLSHFASNSVWHSAVSFMNESLLLNKSIESMIQWPIHIESLATFLNESAVWTNRLNEWFSDKDSDLLPPTGAFSFICKV